MICPKCGNEITEGHLYCEVCGEEIQIVPDFDIQVEESINVTLSSVAGDVKVAPVVDAEGITKEIPTELVREATRETVQEIPIDNPPAKPQKKSVPKKPNASKKKAIKIPQISRYYIVGGAAAVLVIIGVILFVTLSGSGEKDPYIGAQELYAQQQYDLAAEELRKIETETPLTDEETLLLADCYSAGKKYDECIAVLTGHFGNEPGNAEALNRLMEAYIAVDDKASIAALLDQTNDEVFRTKYADYIAPEPLFSLDSGTYTDDDQLSIVSEEEGEIRYTLDGSEPTESSELYQQPFIFDVGEHTVTAVFFNAKGMPSESVQKKYVIEKKMLDDPVLLTQGGQYSDPELISLEKPVGAVIYYTDDGSDPTEEANVYNQPIPMPIREKTYRFIMIDAHGVTSQIVEATYNLQMVTLVDVTMAENAVQLLLKMGGKGVKQSEYKCSSAIRINDRNYYLVEEYSLQTAEKVKTGRVYAVDVLTGELYKADMSSAEGDYKLTPFQ